MNPADLTKRPPRSPRVRLGSYALLPRIIDKCRAEIAGTNGDYKFNCPMDQQFFDYTQIDAGEFKAQVKLGRGDGELLHWVNEKTRAKPAIIGALAWTAHQEQRSPSDLETREFFNSLHKAAGPGRVDISTWFDLLDLDDYVSFGGKA